MKQARIRMYRLGGIGDCFLLSFPRSEGMSHMLVDCGVLKGTDKGKARMQAVVADIVKTTEGRLDVLVVTHEHWDHVSGFLQARDEFKKQLKIGEVWLAWTERPDDKLAKQLREHKKKARKAVDAARQKLKLSAVPAARTAVQALSRLSQFSGDFGAAGRYSTAAAMAWARKVNGTKVLWLASADDPHMIPGLDSVRVFVLGPPRDSKLLKQSDPSKRTPEVYQLAGGMDLGFASALLDEKGMNSGRPFDSSFEIAKDKAKAADFFRKLYFSAEGWRRIELDWLYTAERLALQLDSDTNNTSLVLAIELIDSGRVLLFTGDAQVGNWLSWEPLSWTVKDRNGEPLKVTSSNLLARTVLYKVGHHASHNATLREKGLELMQSDELAAMIPVYEEQAHAQGKGGWEMPFGPLLHRLQEKTSGRIIRADNGVSDTWSAATAVRYVETKDYIDCMIDL
jgi:hypothetical protein